MTLDRYQQTPPIGSKQSTKRDGKQKTFSDFNDSKVEHFDLEEECEEFNSDSERHGSPEFGLNNNMKTTFGPTLETVFNV